MSTSTAQPLIPLSSKSDYLLGVIQRLSLARSLEEITTLVRHAARELVDADGATFVLRDEEFCHYVDEEAIAPLWKGKKFPLQTCVSGWVMLNNETAAIDDIYQDPRVPISAYRPTFVKSLVMTPIRDLQPIGAIGTYWAKTRRASDEEKMLLKVLANSTSIALENVRIVSDLKKSNDSLAELLRSRDEFLSVAAHELRTPLSALKLQLQMTEGDIQSSPTSPNALVGDAQALRDDLAMALRQTGRLEHLIEQLLDISRIRLDRLDLQLTEFSLGEAVRNVADQMALTLKEAGCDLRFATAPTNIRGHWDRLRIEQIVTNLISNACKYAPGQVIDIRVSQEDGDALLIVTDHGPGIPLDFREKVFDRFVRVATADHVSGLGLGLSIVQSIVNAHSGEISIGGEVGEGAIFSVRLPLDPFLKKELRSVGV